MNAFDRTMRRWPGLLLRLWALTGLLGAAAAPCADAVPPARDPMQLPDALQSRARSNDALATPAEPLALRHLLVVDGRRYVVDAGQRHAVGDTLAGGRIERIDDTSVWLRQPDGLRQVSLYGGIVKHAASAQPVVAAATAAAPSAPRAAARSRRDRAALNLADEDNLNR